MAKWLSCTECSWLVIKETKGSSASLESVQTISKIRRCSYSDCVCVQGRAPAPRAAHASATLGCRGYVCGGRVMVRSLMCFSVVGINCMRRNKDKSTETQVSLSFAIFFLAAGNQDKWCALFGPWIMDVVRNVSVKAAAQVTSCSPRAMAIYSIAHTDGTLFVSSIPVSTTPVGRSWHTLTAVSDTSLFLFGGLSVDCKPMSKKM